METSSSILIILVFSSVFSQIFLSITFSSFPSLFLFPRETSHASPPPPPPLLSNPITSTSTFSLLARLLLEHREKFSSHRAYIFNYHPPPLSIIPLPSNKDPTCHVSPFLAPSDPARSVTGAVPHQLFSRSGAGEVKNGRVDLAVAKSGIGNMVTIRVYMCVCVRAWREKHAALELICPSNHLPRTHLDGWRFTRVSSILGIGVEKKLSAPRLE